MQMSLWLFYFCPAVDEPLIKSHYSSTTHLLTDFELIEWAGSGVSLVSSERLQRHPAMHWLNFADNLCIIASGSFPFSLDQFTFCWLANSNTMAR